MQSQECPFCDEGNLAERIIRQATLYTSFVSTPWFRAGHCLVVPNRHITTIAELTTMEAGSIMLELGRLGERLDQGYGTGVIQKYQPLQPQNGIKVNHLHFHVFPRMENENGLFPVPEPNSFAGFTISDNVETDRWRALASSSGPRPLM